MSALGVGLVEALGLNPGSVVSFVGAGGKTSLLFALAVEAARPWGPAGVLVTTTTRMLEPRAEDFPRGATSTHPASGAGIKPRLALVNSLGDAIRVVQARRAVLASGTDERHGQPAGVLLVLGTRFDSELAGESGGRRKFAGIPPEWIDEIARRFPELVVLVEADGAARKPLKAPAAHEPVIPASSTTVLAVAGLDALGVPLDEAHVHRPERMAQLTGHSSGSPVTSEVIATALWHEEGCGKGRPPRAALVPVINKVDGPEQLPSARGVAAKLLERGAPRVLLTSSHRWPVVVEVVELVTDGGPAVAAIILAAGASTRMGATKQLLLWEGEPLVVRTVRQTLAARVGPVVVVLGHKAGEIRPVLGPLAREAGDRLRVIVNTDYAKGGQSSSLRAGLAALAGADRGRVEGVVFVNCDQPLLRAEHIDALIARFELGEGESIIVAPVHDGQHGHPVLFGRGFFGELAGVTGDEGGRSVIRRHPEAVVEVPADRAVLADVDTPEELRNLEANGKQGRS